MLCRSFGQEISVAKIVDFDILDEVAIRDIHLSIDLRVFAWTA
jgi:hypothetical protein